METSHIICILIILLLLGVLVKNSIDTYIDYSNVDLDLEEVYDKLRDGSNDSVKKGSSCYVYDKLMEDRSLGKEIPKTCSSASSLTNISDSCKKKYCLVLDSDCSYSSGECTHKCDNINTGSGTESSKKSECQKTSDCIYDTSEPDSKKKCKQKLMERKPILYQSNSVRAADRCNTVNAICEGDEKPNCLKRSCVSDYCKIKDNKCVLKDNTEISYINNSLSSNSGETTYSGDSAQRTLSYGTSTSGTGVAAIDYSGITRPSSDFKYNSMGNYNSDFTIEDLRKFYSSTEDRNKNNKNNKNYKDSKLTSDEFDYSNLLRNNSRQNVVVKRERDEVGSTIVQSDIVGVGNIFAPEIIIE